MRTSPIVLLPCETLTTLTQFLVLSSLLDDNKEDGMSKYEQEEALVKIEPDQMVGATAESESNTRRSGWIKIANRQFEDYELYTTVEEEEQLMLMLVTVEENPAGDEEDEEVLAAVAYFIMVHCKEKEGIKNNNKKKYKPKAGHVTISTHGFL